MAGFRPGERVLVAVSGGADSVALLFLLKERAAAGEISLSAAHFEHGIRGEASLRDADFVRALCARLAVPLTAGAADVPGLATEAGLGLEDMARRARYRFLRETAAKLGAGTVATAHHLGDQAETVLMHLLRGGGGHGAAGMAVRSEGLWRPLLGVAKEDLVAYLRSRGETWREDASNERPDTPRNALRLTVTPRLKEIYPGYASALSRFSLIQAEEDEYLARESAGWLRGHYRETPFGWAMRDFADCPTAILRRALKRIAPEADFAAVERMRILTLSGAGATEIGGGWRVKRCPGGLYGIDGRVNPPRETVPLADGAVLPGLGTMRLVPGGTPIRGEPYRQCVNAACLQGALLRTRRPGDTIRPFGMTGRKRLCDYFIDLKIDAPLRDYWPLVAVGSEVLWAVGAGLSETARARPGDETRTLEFLCEPQWRPQ